MRLRVTAAEHGTLLDEVARLLENAGQSRSRYVRLAELLTLQNRVAAAVAVLDDAAAVARDMGATSGVPNNRHDARIRRTVTTTSSG